MNQGPVKFIGDAAFFSRCNWGCTWETPKPDPQARRNWYPRKPKRK